MKVEDLRYYSHDEKEFLALVLKHSGCFMARQFKGGVGRVSSDLADKIKTLRHARIREYRQRLRVFDLTGEYPPHRFQRLKPILMALDLVLDKPEWGWRPTLEQIYRFPVGYCEQYKRPVYAYIDWRPMLQPIIFDNWLEKNRPIFTSSETALVVFCTTLERLATDAFDRFQKAYPKTVSWFDETGLERWKPQTVRFASVVFPDHYPKMPTKEGFPPYWPARKHPSAPSSTGDNP